MEFNEIIEKVLEHEGGYVDDPTDSVMSMIKMIWVEKPNMVLPNDFIQTLILKT